MQTIIRGQANNVYFTLTERVTLSIPYFLMRVTSRSSRENKTFILSANQSSYTYRYDKFIIIENDTDNLLNSQIKLLPSDWDYQIYEQASNTNLDIVLTTTLLEEGILRVLGQQNTTNYYNGNDKTIIYYANT